MAKIHWLFTGGGEKNVRITPSQTLHVRMYLRMLRLEGESLVSFFWSLVSLFLVSLEFLYCSEATVSNERPLGRT